MKSEFWSNRKCLHTSMIKALYGSVCLYRHLIRQLDNSIKLRNYYKSVNTSCNCIMLHTFVMNGLHSWTEMKYLPNMWNRYRLNYVLRISSVRWHHTKTERGFPKISNNNYHDLFIFLPNKRINISSTFLREVQSKSSLFRDQSSTNIKYPNRLSKQKVDKTV